MRKNITATILALLALSVLTLTLKTQPVKADPGYIYIRSDGSIYPPGRPIQRNGDYYTLTGDLSEGIRIERNNMTLDGSSYKISGASYTGIGVNVTGISHVMLENLNIHKFQNGIAFINSSFCQLYHSDIEGGLTSDDASIGVNVTNSAQITLYNDTARAYRSGIKLFGSSYNRVFNCTSFWNNGGDMVEGWGIDLASASNFNDVFDNYVADNHDGIGIQADSSNSSIATYNNSINYNTIFDSSWHGEGIGLYSSTYNNTITRNNFWNNTLQANVVQSYNDSWDGGYPSYTLGGNHWSDYTGTYNESTHIGETPYNITSDNKDNYPLEFYNYTYEYLTVQSAGNGTTDPVPDTYPYPYPGMNVTATANADPGYVFDHWVLDGTTNMTDNPVTIAMDSSHTLTACFRNPMLTISTLAGEGTTDPAPGTYTYSYGTNVSVTAHNSSDWAFDYWLLDMATNFSNPINVTMTTDHALIAYFYPTNESCPFVSTWNGTSYVLDNNILPQSETSNGTDVTDHYTLEQPLVPSNGQYALMLSEFEHEHSFIDYTQLLAVDHPANVNVGVSPSGQVLTYTHPYPAVSAVNNDGNNVTQLLSQIDGNYYQGYNGSYVTLNFGRLDVSRGAKLVIVSDMIIIKCPIYIQTMDAHGNWQTVATIYTRNHWATDVIDLKNYLPEARGKLMVRLCFVHNDTVDFVGLDTSPQARIDIHPGQLVSAISSADGDVTAKLLYADKTYAELVPGENIQLAFNLPEQTMRARTYIFIAEGHYYTITP